MQEIAAITYVPQLPLQARKLVEELADSFSWILRRAIFLEQSLVPRRAWYYWFTGQPTTRARNGC